MSVSLYCSPTNLRLLVGSASTKQVKIDQFVDTPLPENAMLNGIITGQDAMTRFLTETNDQYGPFRQDAVLCVESSLIRSRIITVPKVPDAQMLRFVTEELQSSSDSEASDVFDFATLGTNFTKGGVDVLGIAAGRALLAAYIEVFSDAGFKIKRIDVGTNALIKLTSLSPRLTEENSLLALVDGQALFLALFNRGRFILMKKYRLMHPLATEESYRELGNHISTLVQFQKTQDSESDIQSVYITGVPVDSVAPLSATASYLSMPIAYLDISERLKLAGKALFEQNTFDASRFLFNIGTLVGR
ncbi:MAG: pilus assembly protein PilM [Coriobacteriales bacterium]|jgi:hypothetical protein|nr:pilus assembly protein PilM [Coriobacteriales bacterium]